MKLHTPGVILLLLLLLPCLLYCAEILDGPDPPSCTQQGLNCAVTTGNCMDPGWLIMNDYTPDAPQGLKVEVGTRHDRNGRIQPVLVAQWELKDEGSIRFLNATEIDVHVIATNQHLCVRYSFPDLPLPMKNPLSGQKWSFTVDMVVVDPGQKYWVSVFNVPKPELAHTPYDVSREVTVPNCRDPKMKGTEPCVMSGSFWMPNITLELLRENQSSRPMLSVIFNADQLSQKYLVLVRCSFDLSPKHTDVFKKNETSLTVNFLLEDWPRSCCVFDVEIAPYFPHCGNDCVRQRGRSLNICRVKSEPRTDTAPAASPSYYWALAVVAGLLCSLVGFLYIRIRLHRGPPDFHKPLVGGDEPRLPKQPPKVLVIYSQDHRLYRDVVLKLCAFLKAKCGAEVLVDLLDSAGLGTVGPMRWLEWQRQQLTAPSDKMLVLCSPGVQAKWRAMCGQGRVMLREDVLSPTDDMLIPFLNLLLPDMHQAAPLGKYMVAYFDDICGERDVPSVLDLGVKYKLMKHFEELYFRILDIEKYQPGQVNHIQGIGGDEYFNCSSGRDLRNAIETFQAYQLENPDWFEAECVESEEVAVAESNALIERPHIPPVLECVPLFREGAPIYVQDIELHQNQNSVHVLTPEVNPECHMASVVELQPRLNPECRMSFLPNGVTSAGVLEAHVSPYSQHTGVLGAHVSPYSQHTGVLGAHVSPYSQHTGVLEAHVSPYSQHTGVLEAHVSPYSQHTGVLEAHVSPYSLTASAGVLEAHVSPYSQHTEPVYVTEPVLRKPPWPTENWPQRDEGPFILKGSCPAADEEEALLSPQSQPSPEALQRLEALQWSLGFGVAGNPSVAEYLPSLEAARCSQAVEMDEGGGELLEPSGKGPNSGSDQGYISKMSTQPDSPVGGKVSEDPLMALVRLQEELFQKNHGYTGMFEMA